MRFDTPAVIVGAGINGLGVARSLSRAGVPAWLLDSDPHRAELRTRAARPWTLRALAGDALVEDLIRFATTRLADRRPVLLLTQEAAVATVSSQRERLLPHYRLTLPPAQTVTALQHKYGFQRLAERFNAPISKLVRVRTPDDLAALSSLQYPAVVKPGAHDAAYGRVFKKAYRVETLAAANEIVARILPVLADAVVQEWIEGPDSSIYFCLQAIASDGRLAASFTGRKIRSWPPHVGGTASCVPAPEAAAKLTRLTTEFFRAAGVVGLASMEYKRDERTGAFRMVEPTVGRTDYQEEVATLNGVNLPCAAYCAELGLPWAPSVSVARPVAWRVRSGDLQSAAAQGQTPSSGFNGVSRVADALWRASDPRPWMVYAQRRVHRGLRTHFIRKLAQKSEPVGDKP